MLEAARRRFAAHGYERTAIRAIAADAGIDPSMVMRYYGNKSHLFDAALDVDLYPPDLAGVPADDLLPPALLLPSADPLSRVLSLRPAMRPTHRPALAAPTTSAAGDRAS
ncbi:helix-turn-helix domain-containing protein [Streptomyces sp. NBC_01334]|uniref:helix-turn-helix domain-containing protein n=1 Tax=Streptomyces sp. NBC_01334 TaxID=2903827 RepID=UPI003FA3455B